jgi:hypothetical protein
MPSVSYHDRDCGWRIGGALASSEKNINNKKQSSYRIANARLRFYFKYTQEYIDSMSDERWADEVTDLNYVLREDLKLTGKIKTAP